MGKHKSSRRHERPINSYDRRPGKRAPGRCLLIVCEGAETEPNYFKELRKCLKLPTVQVEIQGRGGVPISLVDKAKQLKEKREKEMKKGRTYASMFEEVWCVFDVENPNINSSFYIAVSMADARGYSLAISNPAFEFWYIVHFECTTLPLADGREAKKYLQQHYIPEYQESMDVFNKYLVDNTLKAINNAKSILKSHNDDQRFPNPSTQVHLLVEEMIKMSSFGCILFAVDSTA